MGAGVAVREAGGAWIRGEGEELPPAMWPMANPANSATMITRGITIPAVRRIKLSNPVLEATERVTRRIITAFWSSGDGACAALASVALRTFQVSGIMHRIVVAAPISGREPYDHRWA